MNARIESDNDNQVQRDSIIASERNILINNFDIVIINFICYY